MERNRVWIFTSNGCRTTTRQANEETVPELQDPDTVHLFDAKAPEDGVASEPSRSSAFLVIFSSSNGNVYKQLGRSMAIYGFPSCDLSELLEHCEKFNVSKTAARKRHAMFGGSFRLVLGLTPKLAKVKLEEGFARFLPDNILRYLPQTSSSPVVPFDHGPSVLFQFRVNDPAGTGDLFDTYQLMQMTWSFASNYIVQRVLRDVQDDWDRYLEKVALASKKFGIISSFVGNMLQPIAPKLLAAEQTEYEIRDLSSNKVNPVGKYIRAGKVLDVIDNIVSIEDALSRCVDPFKLFSLCGTVPAIDIFCPPFTYYQLTVSKSHKINLKAILKICKHARSIDPDAQVELIFVVTTEVFHSYKYQQPFDLGANKQAMLESLTDSDCTAADRELLKSCLKQRVLCIPDDRTIALVQATKDSFDDVLV